MLQHSVVFLLQTLNHALHEPLGHVFAGMLLGDEPDLALAFAAIAFAQQ
ncbi:hypothetical protein APX70_05174, partial [Pseudomonas syringae pv. maculicola]